MYAAEKLTRRQLLELPHREWKEESEYESLLILPGRTKHGSGWAQITIIGIKADGYMEIAATCPDDLSWHFPAPQYEFDYGMRTDCIFKNKCLHFWHARMRFKVGMELSSIEIHLIPKK
jgi:hypothetical protein